MKEEAQVGLISHTRISSTIYAKMVRYKRGSTIPDFGMEPFGLLFYIPFIAIALKSEEVFYGKNIHGFLNFVLKPIIS